jgi:hypothetical protein
MSSFDCSLPGWVAPWCRTELGVAPTEALFVASVVSEVRTPTRKPTQRVFELGERRVAWGASLWPALFNARRELAFGHEPLASSALAEQAEERLLRAQI